jgi:hypothetical protein
MEKLAVEYATRMSYVTTMDVLRTLWAEILADRKKLGEEWFSWLRDFKDGTKIRVAVLDMVSVDPIQMLIEGYRMEVPK